MIYILDSWITKFLAQSSPSEIDRFFDVTNKILQKIEKNSSHNVIILRNSIYRFVLPYIKTNYNQLITLTNLPSLTSNLCISAGHGNIYKFDELLKFFINSNNNPNGLIKFWIEIIECDKISKLGDEFLIRNWIKCCLLLQENTQDLQEFTNFIISLKEIQKILNDESDREKIKNSKYPLHIFFELIGFKYRDSINSDEKLFIIDKMRKYLLEFDKLTDAIIYKTRESTIGFYKTIAKLVHFCSPIIYCRLGSDGFFNAIMTKYIIPTSLLMGRTPELVVTQSIHLVLPMIIDGLSKLDYINDDKIKKYLNEIILKWTPNFKFIVSLFFFIRM